MTEIVDGVEYPDQHEFNKTAQNEIADRLKVIQETVIGGSTAKIVHGKLDVTTADNYMLMVDLSDIETFPHNESGRVDVYGTGFFVSKTSSAAGSLQIGVITRIDETDADISFTHGVSFSGTSERDFSRDRPEMPPDRLGQSGGVLTSFSTNFLASGVTQVNTATALDTNYGTATPAVGDIVGRFHVTAGTLNTGAITLKYAGNVSAA